jgi:hypothetical protein
MKILFVCMCDPYRQTAAQNTFSLFISRNAIKLQTFSVRS